jgi:putative phage-type endonuclease
MQEIKVKHGSQEWLKFRINGIGGSDASAILGANPYKSNVELWEEKTGLKPPKPVTCKEAVDYGKKAEKHLRSLFALDFKDYSVIEKKDTVFVENGFMFASLDGLLEEKATGRRGILEIKTADIFQAMHKERWNEKIPQNYYIQVLHYMAVMKADFAVLKAQLKYETAGMPDIRIKHFWFNRDDEEQSIKYLIEQETKFWEMVKAKKRPALILPEI